MQVLGTGGLGSDGRALIVQRDGGGREADAVHRVRSDGWRTRARGLTREVERSRCSERHIGERRNERKPRQRLQPFGQIEGRLGQFEALFHRAR